MATKTGIEGHKTIVHAPLITLTKGEIILLGTSLGVDYSMSVSCYRATIEGKACGLCDSCAFRKKGFSDAGLPDVTSYTHSELSSSKNSSTNPHHSRAR